MGLNSASDCWADSPSARAFSARNIASSWLYWPRCTWARSAISEVERYASSRRHVRFLGGARREAGIGGPKDDLLIGGDNADTLNAARRQ